MTTDASNQGQAAEAGIPTNGANASATIPEPTEIRVVVESGSRPTFIRAFHPAWHAAANKTARKTKVSMRRLYRRPGYGNPAGGRFIESLLAGHRNPVNA